MNKHAIYHIVNTPYAYGKDKNTLYIKLRTAKDDIKSVKLFYKDRYSFNKPYMSKAMDLSVSTDLFDFYETEVSLPRNRYRYYFEISDFENSTIYLDDRGLAKDLEEMSDFTAFQYAYLGESDVYEEAKWLQESVVYQIFPDRFNNGDKSNDPAGVKRWGDKVTVESMFGGDLQGIIDKLDYLSDLGINLIYLTPVFKSTTNHKYNTMDYYEIDPQFGTKEKAKELINKCHEKGIKVIFDAVFNHTGSDFFAFSDLLKNQEKSKYKDWYFVDSYPVSKEKINYYTFADNISEMPKINVCNKEARKYLLDVGRYWVKEFGIDGWRLDVCDEVDHDFWKDFRKAVKEVNKDAVIIGEVMHEAGSYLSGSELDSIMNYPFKIAMTDFFAKRVIDGKKFNNILSLSRASYMKSITSQMLNLIDCHDTKRFLTECSNDKDKMKLAIAFQFTYLGVPYIYYGDEVGMSGGDDPDCRRCMIWDEKLQDLSLKKLYKDMIKLRKENKALIFGSYKNLYTKENTLAYLRSYEDEKIVVLINNSHKEETAALNLEATGKDLLSGETIKLDVIKLKPMSYKFIKM